MKNNNILIKMRDELQKEKPDLSYVRGMLDVLIESEPVSIATPAYNPSIQPSINSNEVHITEIPPLGISKVTEIKKMAGNIDD